MVFKIYSGRVGGIFADLITCEVDASPGLPGLEMIGLLGSEVKEAKDRVRVALRNNGINLPAMKITVNLSPADEHKAGAAYDLPIAVALLGVFGYIKSFDITKTLIIGELSLDGAIRPVRGILPVVQMAVEKGFERVILPVDNAAEGALIKNISIIAVSNLSEVLNLLSSGDDYIDENFLYLPTKEIKEDTDEKTDFSDVRGQETAKRAALIGAAGFHHILMTGPPGTGKSLIAKRIPTIMPKLSYEEQLQVTTIYSVAGKLKNSAACITERPFLSPHHTVTPQALVGGGANAVPGLISLSHKGILFLDEMPEFKKQTLDYLRQPLEDGQITVSRSKGTVIYPADFMLVAAMNPCPCGYYPDRNKCMCTESAISRYLSKISGPILDRIDICVEVSRMDPEEIENTNVENMTTEDMAKAVLRAVDIQKNRYMNEPFSFNSQIPSSLMNKYVSLSENSLDFMHDIYHKMNLSMRSYYKIMRVARTIADIDGDENVEIKHLAEASCYRFPDYMGG